MPNSGIAILLAVCAAAAVACGHQVINTKYGPVIGKSVVVHLNSGDTDVTSFYGIPYAAPPTGALRFEPPEDHDGWEHALNATSLPDLCMQTPFSTLIVTHPVWLRFSEDCLTLTVFKPTTVIGALPVMVWFHGGGYVGGGSIQYPGHFLAARDVIVVVVNYRLGIFGFASTADDQIPGNMGMLDQVKALMWVQDNIENFGGLRNRVTIFGQSAGASSAALHMISPLSRGLFHQAILESGAESNMWSLNFPGHKPDEYINQVAEKVSCPIDDITEMVACMKAVPARQLRMADELECTPGYFCQGFAPIIDGPGGFIPEHPMKLREELGSNSVPIMSGFCSDDASLYTLFFIPEALRNGMNRTMFQYYMRERLISIYAPQLRDEEIVENVYRAFEWKYTPWPHIEDENANREGYNKMLTDAAFGLPWDRNAKLNSEHADTFTYIFGFRTLNESVIVPPWMGVPHSGDLPYVWGYGYLKTNPEIRRESLVVDIVGWTPEDALYADYIQTLWSNFAKYGDPTPVPIPGPLGTPPLQWPRYNVDDNMKVFNMFMDHSVTEFHRQPEYSFLTEYMSYVSKIPIKKSESAVPRKPVEPYQFHTRQIRELHEMFARAVIEQQYPDEVDEIMETLKQL